MRLKSLSEPVTWFWIFLVGIALSLGPTDDEAYYWAIALPFKWGFAYHPPGILWQIGFARFWLGDGAGVLALRLVNLLFAWGTWRLALNLIPRSVRAQAGWLLIFSLPALWGAAWMAVPDWGQVFFSTLLMVAIFENKLETRTALWLTAVGACGVMLFKLTGVLAIGSAGLAVILWGGRLRWKFLAALWAGAIAGLLPFVGWNAAHGWGAIHYQLSERHGGWQGLTSFLRLGRFWLLTVFLVGPVSLAAVGLHLRARMWKWLVWILPPLLVFGLQPLWGDFKLHWIWIAFWPAVIGLLERPALPAWLRSMSGYGAGLIVIVWFALLVPLIGWMRPDRPLLDPSADLMGFEQVPAFLRAHGVEDLPLVAGRYQVAGQLAFALRGNDAAVTELPLDSKERSDWPDLHLVDTAGRLTREVVYFADERYAQGPEVAWKCAELGTILPRRHLLGPLLGGPIIPGKSIRAWRCR